MHITTDTPFAQVAQTYLSLKAKMKSYPDIRLHLNKFIQLFGERRLIDIRRRDIQAYIKMRLDAGRALATVKLEIAMFNAAHDALKRRLAASRTSWVFARPNGKRILSVDERFAKARELAHIEDFRIHDLRHTFASWLVSSGVDLLIVRDLLGHASIKMTEIYAHLIPNRLDRAVASLEGFNERVGLVTVIKQTPPTPRIPRPRCPGKAGVFAHRGRSPRPWPVARRLPDQPQASMAQ